jgi:hypothetical protein
MAVGEEVVREGKFTGRKKISECGKGGEQISARPSSKKS